MSHRPPTPEQQLRFLRQFQRLLDEGSFVATYKFALLHAIVDLGVAKGDDSGARCSPMSVSMQRRIPKGKAHRLGRDASGVTPKARSRHRHDDPRPLPRPRPLRDDDLHVPIKTV